MKNIVIIFLTLLSFVHIGLAQKTIDFSKSGYYPEGLAYYEKEDLFLVSSMSEGEIGAVDKNGKLSTFISDEAIVSPIGIQVDEDRGLLYVTNSDIGVSKKTKKEGQGKTAQILVYDLKTKKKKKSYDLSTLQGSGGNYFFANDVAYDDKGNLYITNSFGPNIWKIDSKGRAIVFVSSKMFSVGANHFGLNGLAYHPDGYLIVGHYEKGLLFKVPVSNPSAATQIEIGFTPIGADGLELVDKNTVVIVANGSDGVKLNTAYTLESKDGWKTAHATKATPLSDAFPTSTTTKKGQVFTLYTYIDKMLSGAKPATETFTIVELKNNQ